MVAARDPKEVECEFCEDGTKSVYAHAMLTKGKKLPTGQYVYTCGRHRALGEAAVAPKERQARI